MDLIAVVVGLQRHNRNPYSFTGLSIPPIIPVTESEAALLTTNLCQNPLSQDANPKDLTTTLESLELMHGNQCLQLQNEVRAHSCMFRFPRVCCCASQLVCK